jgi:hypothetical protein
MPRLRTKTVDGYLTLVISNKQKIKRRYNQRSQKGYANWNLLFFAVIAVGFGLGNIIGIYLQQVNIKYNLTQIYANTQVESKLPT